MADRLAHARGWFLKGESDLSAARRILDGEGPYDTACFHIQQAVEKLLKGFLALKDQPIPRTHNLEELARLCQAIDPGVDFGAVDVTELTPFAVESRYDFEFWPTRDIAQEALDLALEVRQRTLAAVPPEARP
ncbi:MAG TPA: HEPN domain-containing protein [Candidatus Methylomirabilis sp.]|nr:HEPN domain-containing protein [Candidatus Methylomirabilis sp.]